MNYKVNKNNNYTIVTEEININNNKSYNLYLLRTNEDGAYIEFNNNQYSSKEHVLSFGSLKNGIYLENCIVEGSPLIGKFSNGLEFHYSKILSIRREESSTLN